MLLLYCSVNASPPELSLVHVILSVDHAHLPGMATALHSLLHHTPTPERVRVHVVMAGGGMGRELEEFLHCFNLLSDRVRKEGMSSF